MTSNVLLASAAAITLLLTGPAAFAEPRQGTVDNYAVQDGHNGVIQYRKTGLDSVFATTRNRPFASERAIEVPAAPRNYHAFPERPRSGKN